MKAKSLILFFLFFTFEISAYSLDENIKEIIKAVLHDTKTRAPIEYANVTAYNSKDSSFVN